MRLRAATPADFGFVRSVAAHPDHAPHMTDEDETALAAYLRDPDSRLLIWDDGTGPAGFALFCGLRERGVVELRRLALLRSGRGEGAAFLAALVRHGFEDLAADRLWLDVSAANPRAIKVYTWAGFVLEGRLRQHWNSEALGRTVDILLYGLLKSEWQR